MCIYGEAEESRESVLSRFGNGVILHPNRLTNPNSFLVPTVIIISNRCPTFIEFSQSGAKNFP